MPKAAPKQTNFSAGEFSPLSWADVDNPRRAAALALCQNYIPRLQGALDRRTGTKFVKEVKNSADKSRLIRFKFSNTQSYALEFSAVGTIRIFEDYGLLLDDSDVVVEVTSPYTSDLDLIRIAQSGDVLYLVHPSFPPKKLSRTSATEWTLANVEFTDGPYLDLNTTTNGFTAEPNVPGVTLTFSGTDGINDGDGFKSTDVGRMIRYFSRSEWGGYRITAVTDSKTIDVDLVSDYGNEGEETTAITKWRLGVWSDTTGWPSTIAFHDSRLFFAGVSQYPLRVDGSCTEDFENFAPTTPGSSSETPTVTDDSGLSFTIAAQEVNGIKGMLSDSEGLLLFGSDNEWVVRPATTTAALSATNISVKESTYCGSTSVAPIRTDKAAVFIQNDSRKVNEFKYYYSDDGFQAIDISILGEHLTVNGIKEIIYQKSPFPIIWARDSEGRLLGITYSRDSSGIRAGWHQHILGGASDAEGNPPVVESICPVPSPDGSRIDIWMAVKRYINGETKRYVEYITRAFDATVDQKDAFFVDSGLTYDDPKTISDIDKTSPCKVHATAHGFSTGDKVLITDVKGMTKINDYAGLITKVDADSFTVAVDATGYTAYISGGKVRKYVSTITGLDHLEGETVDVFADGAVQASKTVSGGSITLASQAAGPVHIGYGYKSRAQLLESNSGSADGTALGKTRRTQRCGFYLYRSLGLKVGTSFDNMKALVFRKRSTPLGKPPDLFTGVISETLEADYDFENRICLEQDQPGPSTILGVLPQLVTQDR